MPRKGYRAYPRLTCVTCGETKTAPHFPKRGGPYYEGLKTTDPKLYDNQCKRCKKPAKPGQDREKVKEPVLAAYSKPRKEAAKRQKARKRAERAKLSKQEKKVIKRNETRLKSLIYLAENGCEECGERDPRKLEYDHKDPSVKVGTISRLILDGYSWTSPTLRAEISKCRVLCANCHRKHTVEQQGYYAAEELQRTIGLLAARFDFEV